MRASVPQLDLLARVDLFVTHGGMNSVSEGLYYGVPLVGVPQQLEQALNGRQAARHGAGIVVGDTPVPATWHIRSENHNECAKERRNNQLGKTPEKRYCSTSVGQRADRPAAARCWVYARKRGRAHGGRRHAPP